MLIISFKMEILEYKNCLKLRQKVISRKSKKTIGTDLSAQEEAFSRVGRNKELQ
jgi:hypothetical protein